MLSWLSRLAPSLLMGVMLLAGCVTTQTQPDGSIKVRITNDPAVMAASPLGQRLLAAVGPLTGGGDGDDSLSLIPTRNPLGNGLSLYFNGRFDYDCATRLLYAAKSGAPLDPESQATCRQNYFHLQESLRLAGYPYDRQAPPFDPANVAAQDAYWQRLAADTQARLRAAQRFKVRFDSLTTVYPNGQIMLNGNLLVMDYHPGQPVRLVTVPEQVPVVLDDPAVAARIRSVANPRYPIGGDWVACEASLEFLRTVDRGRVPADVSPREVWLRVTALGCRDGYDKFKP